MGAVKILTAKARTIAQTDIEAEPVDLTRYHGLAKENCLSDVFDLLSAQKDCEILDTKRISFRWHDTRQRTQTQTQKTHSYPRAELFMTPDTYCPSIRISLTSSNMPLTQATDAAHGPINQDRKPEAFPR